MSINAITTPVGRLVWGGPFKAYPVTEDNKVPKKDPATGAPLTEYALGIAFAKNDPEVVKFIQELLRIDAAAWPQFHDAAGQLLPGVKFHNKIIDGDGYDKQGRPYSTRDGYAGCWIIKFNSRFAPSCYQHNGQQWVQINDPNAIKPGYYIRVDGTTASNNSGQSPGMYRNLGMVAFIGYGPEIVSGPDANDRFGSAPVALPPGASATPLAPQAALPQVPPSQAGGVAPVPAAQYPAPTTPAVPNVAPQVSAPPSSSTTTSPSSPPTYTGYMQGPPAAPAAPVKVLKPHAQGTYEQYIAAGWSDDQLRQNGLVD